MTSEKQSSALPNDGSTSRSLIARARDNQTEAWERMIHLYTPLVYYWCRNLQLPAQEIPDVVQEVFKSVASSLAQFRKEKPTDSFRAWLRVITRSKAMDYFRKQSRQPIAPGGDHSQQLAKIPEEIPENPEEAQVYNGVFLRALELVREEFHERTWQAFWRVVVDGLSPTEVAEEQAMTAGAVRVAKCRVLHRLRQELGELME